MTPNEEDASRSGVVRLVCFVKGLTKKRKGREEDSMRGDATSRKGNLCCESLHTTEPKIQGKSSEMFLLYVNKNCLDIRVCKDVLRIKDMGTTNISLIRQGAVQGVPVKSVTGIASVDNILLIKARQGLQENVTGRLVFRAYKGETISLATETKRESSVGKSKKASMILFVS